MTSKYRSGLVTFDAGAQETFALPQVGRELAYELAQFCNLLPHCAVTARMTFCTQRMARHVFER
jgi:hypothetical protein